MRGGHYFDRVRNARLHALMLGAAVAAVAGYGFQLVSAHVLGAHAYAPIGVLWTIQYLAQAIALVSVEAYVNRAVSLDAEPGRLPWTVAPMLAWVVAVAGAVAAICVVWYRPLFGGGNPALAAVAALAVLGYGAFAIVRGWLAGSARFTEYGAVTGGESVARFVALVPVAALIPATWSVAWTLPIAPCVAVAVWFLWAAGRGRLPRPPGGLRIGLSHRGGRVGGGGPGGYLANMTGTNAAAQVLLAAGPLVVGPLGATSGQVSTFFVTITAARLPLLFAFGGLLSRVLPPLTRLAHSEHRSRISRISVVGAAATTLLAGGVAAVAAAVGPRVIATLFGAAFTPASWLTAAAAGGVTVATAAMLLTQVLIALQAEASAVPPWIAAVIVAVVVLAIAPLSPTARVTLGFVCGEAVALVALVVAVSRAARLAPGVAASASDSQ